MVDRLYIGLDIGSNIGVGNYSGGRILTPDDHGSKWLGLRNFESIFDGFDKSIEVCENEHRIRPRKETPTNGLGEVFGIVGSLDERV